MSADQLSLLAGIPSTLCGPFAHHSADPCCGPFCGILGNFDVTKYCKFTMLAVATCNFTLTKRERVSPNPVNLQSKWMRGYGPGTCPTFHPAEKQAARTSLGKACVGNYKIEQFKFLYKNDFTKRTHKQITKNYPYCRVLNG